MSDVVGTQLRGWDAATWRAATTPSMRSTVTALVLLDATPDWERLRARFERLTLLVPVLRKKPLFGFFGLSSPRMAIDPDFDLDVHLRRYRLPAGGGWAELMAEARRMSLTDFDRYRPLWEGVLIEGLPGGRSAMILKLHHTIADGRSTVMMALSLFEFSADGNADEPAAPPPPRAEDATVFQVSYADLTDNLERARRLATRTVASARQFAREAIADPASTAARSREMLSSIGRFTAVHESPLSPLMVGRGTTYHFAAFDLPFADLRARARAGGHSVNDVFMAAIATGLERYHERHGTPAPELRFNVPISTADGPGDRSGQGANAVTIARFPLPVSGSSIEERMRAAHDEVSAWRDEPALDLANPLADISWVIPVPVLAKAAQASDVTTSNVPGPPIPLFLVGVRVSGLYPLVATIGAAVNVTMVTYDRTAFVGISADDRAVPDLPELVEDLRAGVAAVTGSGVGPADPFSKGSRDDATPKARAIRATAPASD